MASLVLHELTGSPNNVKVRIGLGYKRLAYERKPVTLEGFPGNRTELVRISRQPRAPVLVHGETVVFESGGILRYLDANFPDSPTLFSTDYAAMGEIEQWELWARTELGKPIGMIFGEAMAPEPDASVGAQASGLINDVTGKIEERLGESAFLMGDTPTGADLACAPGIHLSMLSEAAAAAHPIAAVFRRLLHLGDGRDRTRAWVKKLMAWDEAYEG